MDIFSYTLVVYFASFVKGVQHIQALLSVVPPPSCLCHCFVCFFNDGNKYMNERMNVSSLCTRNNIIVYIQCIIVCVGTITGKSSS